MRRRTRWASYMVAAISAAWLAVVCLYSIGVDRSARRTADALSGLSNALQRVEGRITTLESRKAALGPSPAAESGIAVDEPPPFEPRTVGWGQTRSPRRLYLYRDVETAPGVVERQYIPGPLVGEARGPGPRGHDAGRPEGNPDAGHSSTQTPLVENALPESEIAESNSGP